MSSISLVRPKVAQLSFQLLTRPAHPELFHIYKTQFVERENYQVRIDITSDGHVVRWKSGSTTLTEVASSAHQMLPPGRTVLSVPLRDSGRDTIRNLEDAEYRYEYELQRVPAEMFLMIQQQLGETCKNHELMQSFDASGRIAIGGFSFVHVETRIHSFHVQAIHTFPDDLALAKTESVFTILPEAHAN